MNIEERIKKTFLDLFPLNRSLTGMGTKETLNYLKKSIRKYNRKYDESHGSCISFRSI